MTEDKPKFPKDNPLAQHFPGQGMKPVGPALKNYLKDTASHVNPSAFTGGGSLRGSNGPAGQGPSDESAEMKQEFFRWLQQPLQMEKVHHSVAHSIIPQDLPMEAHILMVNHDWARLLEGADISGPSSKGRGGVRLPYPITVFEFFFTGGVHAVTVAFQPPGTEQAIHYDVNATTHFKLKSGWLKARLELIYDEHGNLVNDKIEDCPHPLRKVYDLITKNVFAISIMLETEVAEAPLVREAYKRNRERPIRRELPGMSHHIVSLARRPRTVRSTYPTEERHSPRLHFRRGHWRHFSSHRTWIKWQLVGNPDLGFVDKDYSL